MCGAFYPHYFRWAPVDEEACQKAMSGHDALTTVVVCVGGCVGGQECGWCGGVCVCVCIYTVDASKITLKLMCTCMFLQLSALPRNAHKYSDQICDLFRLCGRGKALHFEPFK